MLCIQGAVVKLGSNSHQLWYAYVGIDFLSSSLSTPHIEIDVINQYIYYIACVEF